MDSEKDIEAVIERMIRNGVIPMDDDDYDRCIFTGEQIDEIPFKIYNETNIYPNKLYNKCLYNFQIYGDEELLRRVSNLFKSIKIYVDTNYNGLKIFKFRSLISITNKNENDFYSPTGIVIPGKYNALAPIYFTHETHHLLKDTNPEEYKYMLKYADVIPMFYELVEADKLGGGYEKALINNRLALLYNLNKELISYNHNDSLYLMRILKSKKYQYLNSFYYSVILFKLYKENPQGILNLIKKVLKREFTTFDLISILGIEGRDMDNYVKDEINILKKK